MLYESFRRFTQVTYTANENCLEFSFDFRMSKSDKKGIENGVDLLTQKIGRAEKQKLSHRNLVNERSRHL